MTAMLHRIADLFRTNSEILAIVGALTVIYIGVKTACTLWRGVKVYLLARTLGLSADFKSLGSWAVVTGATDGIGRAFAEQLAGQGLNVVLISRSPEKLTGVAEAIEKEWNVKTKCIAVDFSSGFDIYNVIAEGLKGLDIGVLVNNVGMSSEYPAFLAEAQDKDLKNIITVNCFSVVFVTKLILPGMVEKHKGAIINISSLSGCQPVPLLTVYSSTKAFVEFFSAALNEEYKSKGVIVQCIAPGFVATKMSRIRNASMFAPTPDTYVKSALATVGVVPHSYGYFWHAVQIFFTKSVVPSWVYYKMSMSTLLSARARALKKQQKIQ